MTTSPGERVAVCLLTYNHVDVIESTLETIRDQSISGYEIVVSDDCSTDGTWDRILQIAASDQRIKAIQTPRNLGMAGNANFAVMHTSRDFVALLHHDDLCRRDLLEKWTGVLLRHPDVAFVFNSYGVSGTSLVREHEMCGERMEGRWLLDTYLFAMWGCVVHGTAMVRRDAWKQVGGIREEFGLLADVDLWMRLAMRWPVGYVPEPLITVRHQRPAYYPEIYKGGTWSWRRQRYLYEIHGANLQTYLNLHTVGGSLRWWRFKLRVNLETTKWLLYALAKHKVDMLSSSHEAATPYDFWPLRTMRALLATIYATNKTVADVKSITRSASSPTACGASVTRQDVATRPTSNRFDG